MHYGLAGNDLVVILCIQVVLSSTAVVVSLDAQYRPKRISQLLKERLLSGALHVEDQIDVGNLD